ncbi:MAG TPA: AAA family ATPase [Chitinophagaceae bacterium]|nr:AAA family ATPase [Chitinophagaceae bacterium]
MKEKLIIQNFGPIKHIELDLGIVNVLIGEQATGKSTVAKLLAVCRYFSFIIDSLEFTTRVAKHSFWEGLKAWGLDEAIQSDTSIYYENKDYSYSIKPVKEISGYVSHLTPISSDFKQLIAELNNTKPKYIVDSLLWEISTSFYENEVKKVMDNPFYLPTERGLQSIFSLGRIPNISDSLFNQLAKISQISQKFSSDTSIEPLGLSYKNENNVGKIKKDLNDSYISLNKGASGYQSAIPVVLLIEYYTEIKKKKKTFIIEEPEQNLFPSAQYELVKFLADKVKIHNAILLTTHSPYILTSLNNLMYAYQVGQEHDEVAQVVPKKYWINPKEVSAYMLQYDEALGGCVQKDIIDKETFLIDSVQIDGVSDILSEEFNKLMALKMGVEI